MGSEVFLIFLNRSFFGVICLGLRGTVQSADGIEGLCIAVEELSSFEPIQHVVQIMLMSTPDVVKSFCKMGIRVFE